MATGAWLLIGIGCALVIITVLAVFVIPSGRRRQPSSITPRRLTMPRFKIPSGSPTGSLLKGFSYLYAPLRFRASTTALQAGWSVQSHVSMRSIHQSLPSGSARRCSRWWTWTARLARQPKAANLSLTSSINREVRNNERAVISVRPLSGSAAGLRRS